MMKWANKLLREIDQAGWFPPCSRLLVAVSGGSDSVALLHLLHAGAEDRQWQLGIAHLNHCLRAGDSELDARFVRRLGKTLGVPVHVRRIDVAAWAKAEGVSIEVAARECRYQWFKVLCKRHRYSHVVLAHTQNDQAETLLLRLLRGAGLEGLSAMTPVAKRNGMTLVRPFLDTPKQDLLHYLKHQKLDWREDQSNQETVYQRNRVRNELLPALAGLNPDIVQTLARTAERLRGDRDIVEEVVQGDLMTCCVKDGPSQQIDLLAWRQIPEARRQRVVYKWLCSVIDPSQVTHDAVERICKVCDSNWGTAKVTLPGGGVAFRQYDRLVLAAELQSMMPSACVIEEGVNWLQEWGLKVKMTPTVGFKRHRESGIGKWPAEAYVSAQALIAGQVLIRGWRKGDHFSPHGMKGHRKVQDIFTDAKIPLMERHRIPLLCSGNQIVWIPGYRIASHAAVEKPKSKSWHIRIDRQIKQSC